MERWFHWCKPRILLHFEVLALSQNDISMRYFDNIIYGTGVDLKIGIDDADLSSPVWSTNERVLNSVRTTDFSSAVDTYHESHEEDEGDIV